MNGDRKVLELQSAKKRLERKRYADLVLKTYDDQRHQENRQLQERRAEIERKAREAM